MLGAGTGIAQCGCNVMSDIARFRQGSRARGHSVRKSPLAGPTASREQLLEALPVAVYTCDAEGHITFFNHAAAELWGRTPQVGKDKWCGSSRLLTREGKLIPHGGCPMAVAVLEGRITRGEEVIVERPDGSRHLVTAYPQPLRDEDGHII